jgi:tetratricopeptide (TPR) repeat protein
MPSATSYRGGEDQEPEPGPRFDAYEMALLADYGPAPSKIWEFPAYAIRVTTRKKDLGRRLALAKQSAQDAERKRDDRLADLADRIRPQLEASRELAQLLEPLQQIEQTAATRMEALSERNQELEQKVSVVDQEIEAQRGTETSAKGQQDAAAKKLDHARGELERARALLKRAEIELRNVQEVARAAAGPQARTALPEHAEKIQNLTAILHERREAMVAPQAAFDQAQRVWNDADSALKTVQRRISDLQKQRRTIEQSYSKELGVRSQGVEQAQSERRAALVTIGARLMEMQTPIVPEPLRQGFFQAQELLSASIREVERMEQALGTADPAAVKKGWMVLGGGAVVLLLLFVVLIALLGRSDPDPLYGALGTEPTALALAPNRALFEDSAWVWGYPSRRRGVWG